MPERREHRSKKRSGGRIGWFDQSSLSQRHAEMLEHQAEDARRRGDHSEAYAAGLFARLLKEKAADDRRKEFIRWITHMFRRN